MLPSRLILLLPLLSFAASPDPPSPAATPVDPVSRAVSALPSWWKFGVEGRLRFDDYFNLGGVEGKDDGYLLYRTRVNSTFTVRPWLRIFAQAQDARGFGYDRRPVPSTVTDSVDLRQAYIEIGTPDEQPWSLRLGRQPLIFGDMRIIGTSNWSNVGAAFDGLRLTRKLHNARLDWFATTPVQPIPGFDRFKTDRRFTGFYSSFSLPGSIVVEPYALWKSTLRASGENCLPGHLDIFTYGIRSTGHLPQGFDYNIEVDLQHGHIAKTPQRAWGGHFEAGRRLQSNPRSPRVWAEYNYASGDSNPTDNRRTTFEQLFPVPWSVVGRAADFASRNLHEPRIGIEWQPVPKWKLQTTWRTFWLANTQDSLYTLSGAAFASKPGALHSRVGSETDMWAIFQPARRIQFWGGYAHLTAGPFLREAGKGNPINYPYALVSYSLL